MTTAIFQSFNPDVRGWGAETLAFGTPAAVHAAHSLADVPGVLAAAEAAGRAGKYAAVFVAYEAAAAFDPACQTHPPIPGLPLAWCAVFNAPKAIDTAPPSPVTRHPSLSFPLTTHHSPLTTHASPFTSWTPTVTRDDYTAAIYRIRDYIAAGDTYQVNYTFPLHATLHGDPLAAFQTLGQAQGAGYSAYLNLGAHQLLCFSPELFFTREPQKSGDGRTPSPDFWRLTMRPMKGTAARGRFPAEDLAQMRELAACEKNRAENLMILDMLRNDVGRLAIPGSVQVPRMFEVERYRTVHQMTSTVEAMLRPDTGLTEIFTALFPCASITGAPKIRAMQIISELEAHPRGAYTGAIGLVRPGGTATFNVAIRTIEIRGQAPQRCLSPDFADNRDPYVIDKQNSGTNVSVAAVPPPHRHTATPPHCFRAVFGVGGGITWDSTAAGEYDECMLKAAFLGDGVGDRHRDGASPQAEATADFALLESLLLEEGEWFLLERHLARLRASADYFARPFTEPEIRAALAQLRSTHPTGTWKVRLLLNATGTPRTEAQPLPVQKSGGCRSRIPPNPSGEWHCHGVSFNRRVAESAGASRVAKTDTPVPPAHSATLGVKMNPCLWHPPGVSGGARTAPPDFWRVALATAPVDSRDVFLFHKTTRREVYETARAMHPAADDVMLWNEHGELTESCFANLVLAINGELLTPPVACGLLAGTFRQELLETNIIRECILRKDALPQADAIWLINSVRRWIRVELLVERQ